jgi:hypothetical protein
MKMRDPMGTGNYFIQRKERTTMTWPNLILTFTLAGDERVHVRGVARIKVDGRGLTLFGTEKGRSELVRLGSVRSLVIQTVPDMEPATAMVQ